MKKLLACLLCCCGSVLIMAQAPMLGMNVEEEFKVTAVPEKWKNESAVVIAQKSEYLFTRIAGKNNATLVNIDEYVRKRIRLQDKNALENFSTFYYVTMGSEGKAEYQVIKADGKTVKVDMSSAIEEEKDIPSIYRPIYYKMNVKWFKLAIPDLEVGDVIDYTLRSAFVWDMRENGVEFMPFIFSLANNYPTLYQQYRFTMANGMKVKYRGYNGAPNLKFDPKASMYGDRNSYLSYYLMDKDREKSVEERWSYELRNTPSVKFRVILLADNDPGSKSLGEATVDRAGLDIDAVYRRYAGAAVYQTPTVNSLVGYTTEWLLSKKAEGMLKTEDEVIRECYYCLRKVFLEMYYKGPVSSELEKYMTGKKLYKKVVAQQKKDAAQKEEKQDEIRINSVTFATALRMALAAQGIAAELQVYVPRRLGSWRDAIFMEELDFVLRVKSKRKWYYLEAFNNFDAFGTPYTHLESADGYAIGYDELNRYYRANIPATTIAENLDRQDYVIRFDDAMELVRAERTSSFSGIEKSSRIGAANLDREYLNADFQKYFVEQKEKGKKKKDTESTPKADQIVYTDPDKDERIRERIELFEKDVKDEFDIDKYENFELLQDGRYGDTSLLQFREKFTIKKLLSKAGKNYVFDLGKLIGDQIKLGQEEMTSRKGDIWIPFARTIENNVVLHIPAGYTVDGLQDIIMSVDNESGAFISTVKQEENKLIISTKKLYKKNFDKKELWPNYIAFLEPAYKFSQSKIVLKKK